MSFNILFLDSQKVTEMFEDDNLNYLFKVDSIIFSDKISLKTYKLLKKGKFKKIKKLLSKNHE